MSAHRDIPDYVRGVQIEAADPDVSAFVSANAGSGKTHVLAQRVINLLLGGCDPAKILCITFTKAAAANMATRVFGTLAEWTGLDDAALDERIRLSTGKKPGLSERARARRLFASALETPGGLKVQTIHAFCTRLLHQFPSEADVAARFSVLDEVTTARLLNELTMAVLLEASAAPDTPLGRALAASIVAAADSTFLNLVRGAIGAREKITGWINEAGGIDAAMAGLSVTLGIAPDDTIESLEDEFFARSHIPIADWPELIEVLESGLSSDKKHVAALANARRAEGRERIEAYLQVFCTTELAPRKNLVTKGIAERHPEWLDRLHREQDRVCRLLARERALHVRERTRALVTIAKEVIDRYRREKDRRGLLDYDDLIDKTRALFQNTSAAWVLYKLDLGIDHVLIDEAQDTSPPQWDIIKTICSEFVPGGARENVKRTIFAVGDEKQSIFSFQGAAPAAFDEMRRLFERQFLQNGFGWRHLRFHHSFRSGANVLGSVDRVFEERALYASITADEAGVPKHESLPNAAPGLVEIWDLEAPDDAGRVIEAWDAPFDLQSEVSPRVKLARRIAAHVKLWRERGLKAGDVLVLVRQRGPLFEAIIRALKDAGLPVAGADRLVLTEHIAVMDLMALADALLLPEDDLALACVLKSPLFGLSEENLFELAWNRKGSLRESLRRNAEFVETERTLEALARVAQRATPFDFFAHVLGPAQARARILARLGPEANDALDEFLNVALDYEQRETPSLQGFLDWLRAAESDVRRDMEMARDEVRVMTVHGAKGLEANTVILADTTTEPKGAHPPKLLTLNDGAVVWSGRKQDDVDALSAAREPHEREAVDEYRRMLYVAMTRAAERLVVCGAQGPRKIPDGCWYQLVRDALGGECASEAADDGASQVLRYRKHAGDHVPAAAKPSEPAAQRSLPAWLRRKPAPEAPAIRTLTPSDSEAPVRRAPSPQSAQALLRGSLTHRLMQALPDIAKERRPSAARDYLARGGRELAAHEQARIAEQALRIAEHSDFHALYGPDSRAEVPIGGKITVGAETVRVSGQIDRLAVSDDAVLIADFKTDRLPPARVEEAPQSYVRQLALYRAVLERLYPGRPIRAALVFTEIPVLMEISPAMLEAALQAPLKLT
jgi:ATP-dependent helicase/nuclease subunit A